MLLFCPEQGGWHTGLWFEGSWRAHIDLDLRLEPSHWLPVPPDVEEPKDLAALFMGMRDEPELA